jgi:hypothetical protein
MNIAICYSGLVRTYRQTYENHIQNLFEPNKDRKLDVFISTWPIEHSNVSMERTRRVCWYGPDSPPFPENDIDYADIKQRYRPTVLQVESPITFHVPWYQETPGINIQSLMSMIYKINSADVLRRQRERITGVCYDLVVRMRFDTMLPFPMILQPMEESLVVTPSMAQPIIIPGYEWSNDKYAVGNGLAMEIYSNWLHNMVPMVERGVPVQPEIMLKEHLKQHGVRTSELGCEFELIKI